MKFYAEPHLLVRVRNNGPLKNVRPFRFDENGEFETNNKHLIKSMLGRFKSDANSITEKESELDPIEENVIQPELTDDEIRQLAKENKIKSWHVKSIETLKEELGV